VINDSAARATSGREVSQESQAETVSAGGQSYSHVHLDKLIIDSKEVQSNINSTNFLASDIDSLPFSAKLAANEASVGAYGAMEAAANMIVSVEEVNSSLHQEFRQCSEELELVGEQQQQCRHLLTITLN